MAIFSAALVYGRMIKFSHSVFALPFALSGAVLAAREAGIAVLQILWIIVAMVGARSAAMGFNRLADRSVDGANPRTMNRELPRGAVSIRAVTLFVLLSGAVLIGAAYQLNPLCFYLSPLVLAVLLFYSYTKRFTWMSHLFLGLCLGGAPLGAWVAVTGRFDLPPIVLGLAVLNWVAGFDILYACQDREFDIGHGLHSIPARFGISKSLMMARFLHLASVLLLLWVGFMLGLHLVYFLGVACVAGLLIYEHIIVRPEDLSRLGMAFLTMNSAVSVVYFCFTLADLLLLGNPGTLFAY
jgi:4-hydroxybenzoate polyprenyltransferase